MIGSIVLLLPKKDTTLKMQNINFQYNKLFNQTVFLVKPKPYNFVLTKN